MATILVVDEHPANSAFLVSLLGYQGHRLLQAGDGPKALALVRAEHPDLVITDILTRPMDSYEFLHRLRAEPAIAGTPVMVYTAHDPGPETQSLAKALGALYFLTEPCEPELLLRTVAQALGFPARSSRPQKQEFGQEHPRPGHGHPAQSKDDVSEDRRIALDPRRYEGRFSDILRNAALVSLVLDTEARISDCNDYLLRLTGWRREDVLGRDWFELFVPPELDDMEDVFAALLADRPDAWHHTNEILTRSGDRRLIRWHNSLLRLASGEVIGTASIGEDITEQKKAERALAESEERFRQLAENINDVFFLIESGGEILYVSPAYEAIWGRSRESVYADPQSWTEAIHPGDRAYAFEKFTEGTRTGEFNYEYRIRRPDGAVRWIHARGFPICDQDGNRYRTAAIAKDITSRKEMEQRLLQLSHYDTLTGLPNRTLFYESLKRVFAQAEERQWVVSLLFLDLDRFENINDILGHAIGDGLLREVGNRLVSDLRIRDTIGRLGGDEFGLILVTPDGQKGAEAVANKIRETLRPSFKLEGREVTVTASIGITVYPADSSDPDTLIKYADTAMDQAKEAGGDTYRFYNKGS